MIGYNLPPEPADDPVDEYIDRIGPELSKKWLNEYRTTGYVDDLKMTRESIEICAREMYYTIEQYINHCATIKAEEFYHEEQTERAIDRAEDAHFFNPNSPTTQRR